MPDQAALHPGNVTLTIILGLCLLLLPRRWAALPILAAVIFVPYDQRVVIATLDFTMIRILLLFALGRLVLRGEARPLHLNALDGTLIGLMATLLVAAVLLHASGPALVYRLGMSFDALALYFYCRISLRSRDDIQTTMLGALVCLGVFAAFMSIEWTTGRNLFSAIGGVPEQTVVRAGKLRCQGAFSHPILAGSFAASSAPMLFFAFWWRNQKAHAVLGVIFCVMITFFAGSSTPLIALVFGVGALALWPVRHYMRWFRWSGVAMLIILHFVREKPVWHLLARVNVVSGSTGYHRYIVIDRAIAHFDEWWLIGTPDISHWGVHWNDITNQYIATGINGGLLAVILLIAMLAVGFSTMGKASVSPLLSRWERLFAWAVGSSLFVHTVIFLGIGYFGQMRFVWFIHLAVVGTMMELLRKRRRAFAMLRLRGTAEATELRPQQQPS